MVNELSGHDGRSVVVFDEAEPISHRIEVPVIRGVPIHIEQDKGVIAARPFRGGARALRPSLLVHRHAAGHHAPVGGHRAVAFGRKVIETLDGIVTEVCAESKGLAFVTHVIRIGIDADRHAPDLITLGTVPSGNLDANPQGQFRRTESAHRFGETGLEDRAVVSGGITRSVDVPTERDERCCLLRTVKDCVEGKFIQVRAVTLEASHTSRVELDDEIRHGTHIDALRIPDFGIRWIFLIVLEVGVPGDIHELGNAVGGHGTGRTQGPTAIGGRVLVAWGTEVVGVEGRLIFEVLRVDCLGAGNPSESEEGQQGKNCPKGVLLHGAVLVQCKITPRAHKRDRAT